MSVLVCTFNAGAFLSSAVRSILAQTYSDFEVLVVDDGSTDGSVEVARREFDDPRIRWFRQENAGKPTALNRALRELRGEFYAIQDADDLSYPTRIAKQVAVMQDHPDLAAVYCGHDLILGGRPVAPRARAKDAAACRLDIDRMLMPAHDPTGMYRMAMVRNLKYDTDLRVGQGFDYILRVGERWPMLVLGECLYSYRMHSASVTKQDPERRQRLVREVLRRACERRGESFAVRFPENRRRSSHRERDNGVAAHFMESACDLVRVGRRWEAVWAGVRCARLHPLDLHYHKALIYAACPQWLVRRMRGE